MSFVRFSEHSDLYIYSHYLGYIECCGCSLYGTYEAHSLEDLILHVKEHRAAGHKVPKEFEESLAECVTPQDFLSTEEVSSEVVGQQWFNDLLEAMKGASQEEIKAAMNFTLDSPLEPQAFEGESNIEQMIRLALENQLNLFVEAIRSRHLKDCSGQDDIKSCSHEDDIKILKEIK